MRCLTYTALSIAIALICVRVVAREVRGTVFDERGQPVSDVDVCYYWNANGPFWSQGGKPADLNDEQVRQELFGPRHLGEMAPGAPNSVKSDSQGRFVIANVDDAFPTLMAMDAGRQRGGLAVIPNSDPMASVEIRLGLLIRVRGSIEGPGKGVRPHWTNVYIETPYDSTRPLDVRRLANCASNEARFLLSLPPGRYRIDAYDGDFEGRLGRDLVLEADTPDVDLGVIELARWNSIHALRKASQAQGRFGDYTKRYGQTPPDWHVTDARGVGNDVRLSDFKGKWVLLDFWSLDCAMLEANVAGIDEIL